MIESSSISNSQISEEQYSTESLLKLIDNKTFISAENIFRNLTFNQCLTINCASVVDKILKQNDSESIRLASAALADLLIFQGRQKQMLKGYFEGEEESALSIELISNTALVSSEIIEEANHTYEKLKRYPSQNYSLYQNRLDQLRTVKSNTISSNPEAKKSWKKCAEYVDTLAKEHFKSNTPFSLDDIKKMNNLIYDNQKMPNGGSPGNFRYVRVKVGGFEPMSPFHVPHAMSRYIDWLNSEIEACNEGKQNPITLAAIASQRLITIHPFRDGNGRTSRMVADYILQRFQLLPAAIGNASMLTESVSSSKAVQNMTEAVARSYTLCQPNKWVEILRNSSPFNTLI